MRKIFVATFAVFLTCVTANVSAAPITFTHSGNGSGSLDGSDFSNADFTITAQADTDNRDFGSALEWFIDHVSASITINGLGAYDFITGTRTFVANNANTVGFSRAGDGGLDLFNGPSDDMFETWEMLTSIGPVSGYGWLLQWTNSPVETTGGVLVFANANSIPGSSFEADVVPIPGAVWLLGSGLICLLAFKNRYKLWLKR